MNIEFFTLKGKVIIITGGAGLIGKSFVEICARYEATVILVDIDDAKANRVLDNVKKRIENCNIFYQKCDISSERDIKKLVQTVLKKYGKIDALVNNAYPRNKNYGKQFFDVTYSDFCDNVNKNLGGYFLITKEISKQ